MYIKCLAMPYFSLPKQRIRQRPKKLNGFDPKESSPGTGRECRAKGSSRDQCGEFQKLLPTRTFAASAKDCPLKIAMTRWLQLNPLDKKPSSTETVTHCAGCLPLACMRRSEGNETKERLPKLAMSTPSRSSLSCNQGVAPRLVHKAGDQLPGLAFSLTSHADLGRSPASVVLICKMEAVGWLLLNFFHGLIILSFQREKRLFMRSDLGSPIIHSKLRTKSLLFTEVNS